MNRFFFIFASIVISAVFSLPPIPRWKDGDGIQFSVNKQNSIINLDIFACPLCGDCKEFFQGVFTEIYNHYFVKKEKKNKIESGYGDLNVRIHWLPLPYHFAAFHVLKAIVITELYSKNKSSKIDMLAFLNNLWANQVLFSNSALRSKTVDQIYDIIYENLLKKFNFISKTDFLKMMDSDSTVESYARYHFKYSTQKAAYGTPQFLVNDVPVEEKSSFEEWKALFDDLKNSTLNC